MLCEECGLRPATIHLTKIVNNIKVERHLCAECAREKGELAFVASPHFSIAGMLSGLFSQTDDQPGSPPGEKCASCGMAYDDFAKVGRLGCGNCYQRFEARLDPILKRIHGSVEHVGKVPNRVFAHLNTKREIGQLRQKLDEAVRKEAYEEAARLRDRIRDLERPGDPK